MTTRLAPSSPLVKSVNTLPSPLNVASREPFVLYRARANLGLDPSIPAAPAATIFTSALMATSRPLSRLGVKSVVTLPSPPNVASREPLVLYRARANFALDPPNPATPAATIFPPGWMATEIAASSFGVKSVVTVPSPLNLASREPLVFYRARANFALDPPNPATPAATIFPSAWMARSIAHSAFGVKSVATFPSPLTVVSRSPGAADAGPATANDSATKAATKGSAPGVDATSFEPPGQGEARHSHDRDSSRTTHLSIYA